MREKIMQLYNAKMGKIFFDKLNVKTGWGKNEVKDIFLFAQVRAMSEIFDVLLEEKENENTM